MIRRLAARALRGVATEVELVEVRLDGAVDHAVTACGRATDWLDARAGDVLGCGCTCSTAAGCGKGFV